MAEYRRGQGPDALPQGGAAQANQNTPPPNLAGTPMEPGAQIPVIYSGGPDMVDNSDGHLSENMQVLVQPPYEGYQPVRKERPGRVPRYVVRHLPELMAAVKDPSSPPALRALYNAIIRQLDLEQQAGR